MLSLTSKGEPIYLEKYADRIAQNKSSRVLLFDNWEPNMNKKIQDYHIRSGTGFEAELIGDNINV